MKMTKPSLKRLARRGALGVGAAAILVAGGVYGYGYWTSGRFLESTNDAYVQADYTIIAPKISGYIAEVMVDDNQPVKTGQVLAKIDDRDFSTALAQAQADVEAAEASIRNIDAQLALQEATVDQATADITSAEAGVTFAKQDHSRYQDLMKTGYGTVQRAQLANADLQQQTALLQHDRAALVATQKQIEVLKTQRSEAEAQLAHNQAVAQQATLNLSYTTITAPIDGVVGARSLRTGQYVQAGTQLMALVPLQTTFVVANFKETQLTEMRDGQPATIEVDSFPGAVIHGRIDSLAPASGLEFSLLPPDNATGNFTKIVQRIPVKIVLDTNDPMVGLLRVGMSVEASIDTKATVMAEAQSRTQVAERTEQQVAEP
ncbi:HlyD family secretion protein [Hypericibacter sp.]|uniref:HlyD family secretion protein n=1 Tax=Hypericibacter sp. TaxID=2705401 RepID=UPI003D6D1CCD